MFSVPSSYKYIFDPIYKWYIGPASFLIANNKESFYIIVPHAI